MFFCTKSIIEQKSKDFEKLSNLSYYDEYDDGGYHYLHGRTLTHIYKEKGRVASTRRRDRKAIKIAQRPGPPTSPAGNRDVYKIQILIIMMIVSMMTVGMIHHSVVQGATLDVPRGKLCLTLRLSSAPASQRSSETDWRQNMEEIRMENLCLWDWKCINLTSSRQSWYLAGPLGPAVA